MQHLTITSLFNQTGPARKQLNVIFHINIPKLFCYFQKVSPDW